MKNEYDQQLSELEDENGKLVEDYDDQKQFCYCGATETPVLGSVIFRNPDGEEKETWDECCECVDSRPSTDEHCNECGASQATSDLNIYLSGEHAGGVGGDGFKTLEEACRASLCPRYAYSVNEPLEECPDCGSKLLVEHKKTHYEKGISTIDEMDVRYHSTEECGILGCEEYWVHPDGSEEARGCACSYIDTVEPEPEPEPPENCMICNRELTTERAREIKIGPYCEKNLTKKTLHINSHPSDEDLMVILGDFDFAIDFRGLVFKTTRPPYLVRVPLDKETWSQAIPIEKRDAKELLELIGLGDMGYYDATDEIGQATIEQLLLMTGVNRRRWMGIEYGNATIDGDEDWVIRELALLCTGTAYTNNLKLIANYATDSRYYNDRVNSGWCEDFEGSARDNFEENVNIYDEELFCHMLCEAILGKPPNAFSKGNAIFWEIRQIISDLWHESGYPEVFGQDFAELNIEYMMQHGELDGNTHPMVGVVAITENDGKTLNRQFIDGLEEKDRRGLYSLGDYMEEPDIWELDAYKVLDMIELVKGREEH